MGSLARRVLVTSDAERKRLERELHDGAQQRLVAATTTLGLAQRRLADGEPGAQELVDEATMELKRCVEDLRDLARDIYPAVLAERGLGSALHDLVRRAPGTVELTGESEESLPEPVAVTAYLLLDEVLAGLTDGDEARVSALAADGELVVEIHGAGLEAEQLERLGGRVQALGGRIEVTAEPSVRAAIPLDT
ncbi:MAG TPA: histidine kinase [Thermoleophilaceae bacterium]|jgi:signal transduction histidine kinase